VALLALVVPVVVHIEMERVVLVQRGKVTRVVLVVRLFHPLIIKVVPVVVVPVVPVWVQLQ
jgi:hypothetical protein